MNIVLWILQVLLAVLFAWHGPKALRTLRSALEAQGMSFAGQ